MARPKKQTVEYFPHSCTHKKTIYILEQKYGNDGYAFWFKLLEMLGSTDGHYLDMHDETVWYFLQAQARCDEEDCTEILNLLAKLEAIDPDLWFNDRIVWSQNFVDGVAGVYEKRRIPKPEKPVSGSETTLEPGFSGRKPEVNGVSGVRNPQSKVKESRVKDKDILSDSGNPTPPLQPIFAEVVDHLNQKTGKSFRSTSAATQRLIRARVKDGFTLDDFLKVIDNQYAEWGKDPKMQKYLRPETLFGTKFEGYLNNLPKRSGTKYREPEESRESFSYDDLVMN